MISFLHPHSTPVIESQETLERKKLMKSESAGKAHLLSLNEFYLTFIA